MVTSGTSPVLTPDVDAETARAAWAVAARALLLETAGTYRSVVTQKQLTDDAQASSGIETNQRAQKWVGDVLLVVTRECLELGEPDLASLCVNAAGSVGDGYADNVETATGTRPEDPDRHAAATRHECYQHFGAVIPEDGGRPALTPKLEASRARARKVAREAKPILTCPVCFMALPATGVCNNCD